MMKDSKNLIDIYRRYLEVTGDLVIILERNYEKMENEENGLKAKRQEFIHHAEKTIAQMHDDVHKLFRLSWELRAIE